MFPALLLTLTVPTPSPRIEPVHHFFRLTAGDAQRLNGRRIRCCVELSSDEWEHDGWELLECWSRDDVARTVRLRPNRRIKDALIVEGVLRVIRHRSSMGELGTFFPAFTEYRLIEPKGR